ncbi:MAG: hypothetical protein N2169_07175, partial [bacterium]|nr:hypothetical protein [bacterium]
IKTLYKVFFPSILIESVKGYGFEVECYIINSFNYKYIIRELTRSLMEGRLKSTVRAGGILLFNVGFQTFCNYRNH